MGLSFGQANGYEPLPEQAQLQTITPATTATLFGVIYAFLKAHPVRTYPSLLGDPAKGVMVYWWVREKHQFADKAPAGISQWADHIRDEFTGDYLKTYNFVQFFLDDPSFQDIWVEAIANALEQTRAAYRVIDRRIVPFTSEAEHQALTNAIAAAEKSEAAGVRAHLMQAASSLTAGDWAGAVHESISAVEGAAKYVSGEYSKDLNGALAKLKADGRISHPALIDALKKLYAFTSDEKGIRHALVLDGTAKVNEQDAFLMFGLCASFVGYLLKA